MSSENSDFRKTSENPYKIDRVRTGPFWLSSEIWGSAFEDAPIRQSWPLDENSPDSTKLNHLAFSDSVHFPQPRKPLRLFLKWEFLPDDQISLQCLFTGVQNKDSGLRLGLPSTLIRHQNEAFQKSSSNRKNLRVLVWTGRKAIWKQRWHHITMWFPRSSFSQTLIQNDRWLLRFKTSPA